MMEIPATGMPAEAAKSIIESILGEDLDPKLNLATFSTTTFDELPIDLLCNTLEKNMSNQHEYGGITSIHRQCTSVLASLWHGGSDGETPIGTATTGSSEALMLGCLALKKQWAEKRRKQGADTSCPNVIFSSIAHVVCAKFCQYFDVNARILPVTPESGYVLDPEAVVKAGDENTIGVIAVLGSTLTGHYEPVRQISIALDELQSTSGLDIPIHVDAASGGLVAPFVEKDLVWDFQLRRVHSINVSSHKFGQVPTSLGWAVWRDSNHLPRELVFDVDYLDQVQQSWTLSFSRPSFQVVLQYYNFIRNGFDGTKRIIQGCMDRARYLSLILESTSWFDCISNVHRYERRGCNVYQNSKISSIVQADQYLADNDTNGLKKDGHSNNRRFGLPVVAIRFSDVFEATYPKASLDSLSKALRGVGYSVPYCTIPLSSGSIGVLRIVVRPGVDDALIRRLVNDIDGCIRNLYFHAE